VEALSGRGADAAPAPPPPRPAPPVTVLGASPHEITEDPVRDPALLASMRGRWPVLWVHVAGMGHAPTLEALRAALDLPAAAVERVLDPAARASLERFGACLLLVAPFGAGEDGAPLGRAAVLAGPDFVATFEEGATDRFAALVEGLRSPYSRLRGAGSAAVALGAMEAACDPIADAASAYGGRVDALAGAAPEEALAALPGLRRELGAVRRALAPLPAELRAAAVAPAPLPADAAPRLRALAARADAGLDAADDARDAAAVLGEAALGARVATLERALRERTVAGALAVLLVLSLLGWLLLGLGR
jgi:Mg2+ and Co2+ transporter CorA